MVLIISKSGDFSTGQVIQWLIHLKKPFLRINEENGIILKSLTNNNFSFEFKNKNYFLNDFSSCWYRRGIINFKIFIKDQSMFKGYNESEAMEISTYIHNLLRKKKNINNFNFSDVNKLDVLNYCKENGLNDSEFLVTQSKQELKSFLKSNQEIISKPMKNPFILSTKDQYYFSYTHLLSKDELKDIPEFFTPTFFQKHIIKKYEIRTFYLEGDFFSMSIFSQNNSRTQVDFRKYDKKTPNRTIPFVLPEWYRKKLSQMMNHFELNSASLDTIITKQNKYHMLDLNPVGQFGMTSKPCNYNLEKLIAQKL